MGNHGNVEDVNKLNELCDRLSKLVSLMRKRGEAMAVAENEYRKILAIKSLELKESGMAVTLLDKVVYGTKEVALKRLERDITVSDYDALKETINVTKTLIRVLENQINREWGLA